MAERFVTAAQAAQMRTMRLIQYAGPVDFLQTPGVLGVITINYYVVPDDDPRLLDQATPDLFTEA